MVFKNLKRAFVLATFSALLGSTFTIPVWSMEMETNEISSPGRALSFFQYDFHYLEDAQRVVSEADFLDGYVRSFFEQSVKTYDRRQFLQYLDSNERQTFLKSLDSTEGFKFPLTEEILAKLAEGGSPLDGQTLDKLRQLHAESATKRKKQLYDPYFNNIKHNIQEKGPLNYALFDAFFYHLLGIGKLWNCGEQDIDEGKENFYTRENLTSLFLQLKETGFLKIDEMDSLFQVKKKYNPSEQLEIFQRNRKEAATDLVIAGGHIGPDLMESISRYKNALTIDLDPLRVPDIIADINDEKLLSTLVEHYESHFDTVYDTFNSFYFGSAYKEETVNTLVRLLKPGGSLMRATSSSTEYPEECPSDYEISAGDSTNHLIEKHDLIPVYSINDKDIIIGLKKK